MRLSKNLPLLAASIPQVIPLEFRFRIPVSKAYNCLGLRFTENDQAECMPEVVQKTPHCKQAHL
jgi:hypothetical protein